jgi:xanthine dehydrogenase accessory factor
MKHSQLKEIIKKKASKTEFAIVTNLENGLSEIYEPGKSLSKEFEIHKEQIDNFFKLKKNGVIEKTEIFVETYIRPIKIIIVGAVHIAQYLVDFAKSLNFEISIIDPRGYFASEQRFPDIKIINKWPDEAFKEIETNENSALIALTHDPKIDDPALQHALKKKFYYIGALGSKKTHENRCQRLKESGFTSEQINSIHGPIGIKLGGRSAPEIALSIIAQLVSKTYKK